MKKELSNINLVKTIYYKMLDVQIQINCWYLIHVKKTKCCICGEPAVLLIDSGEYICEDCAQICGEINDEKD